MQGSTSPEKNGSSSCSHLLFSRTRVTARRAGSLSGSRPISRRSDSVQAVEVHARMYVLWPHWPFGAWKARSRAPQPSEATLERSAATTSSGSSVRSRMTCQRIEGSESNNHSTTVMSAPRATPAANPANGAPRSWLGPWCAVYVTTSDSFPELGQGHESQWGAGRFEPPTSAMYVRSRPSAPSCTWSAVVLTRAFGLRSLAARPAYARVDSENDSHRLRAGPWIARRSADAAPGLLTWCLDEPVASVVPADDDPPPETGQRQRLPFSLDRVACRA